MMLYSPFMFSSFLAGLALMTSFHPMVDAVGAGTVQIQSINSFTFDTEGATSIVVNYQLDGTVTFGPSSGGNNFYVKQSLLDATCTNNAGVDNYAAFIDQEPGTYTGSLTTTGTTTTTLARGPVPFPAGATSFCLRVQLMLDMLDPAADQVWQQVDFKFTVTATYPVGSATAVYSATEDFGEDTFDAGTTNAGDTTIEPTITATLVGGPFGYGDNIPIVVGFNHPLDVFGYTLAATTDVFLSEVGSSTELSIGSTVKPIIGGWVTGFNFATRTIGTLTVQLPLIIYQSSTINAVQVNIPISWSYRAPPTRRLQGANGTYTGPRSGVTDGMVEVELAPYTDESGAIIGFTVTSVVSSVCLGAAATLLL